MRIKNYGALVQTIICSSVVIGTSAYAINPVIDDTRLYVGACPSQHESINDDNQKSGLIGLGAMVGGKLVETGINALGNALVKAGDPKDKSIYAAANFTDLDRLGECLVIIKGKFSLRSNQKLIALLKEEEEDALTAAKARAANHVVPSVNNGDKPIARSSQNGGLEILPNMGSNINVNTKNKNDKPQSMERSDQDAVISNISCDFKTYNKNNSIDQIAESIQRQTDIAVDGLTPDKEFGPQKENIKKVLNANCIQLADVPNTYIELRLFTTKDAEKKDVSGIFMSPVVIAIQKPSVRNAFGLYTGKRDILISAAFNSVASSNAVGNMLSWDSITTPSFIYIDPIISRNCALKADSSTLTYPNLCGGDQSSPWLKVPDGKGPYRLEVSVTETRRGSAFAKAIGEAIVGNKEKLTEAANKKLFNDYQDAADREEAAQKIADDLALNQLKSDATASIGTALEAYNLCKNYKGKDKATGILLLRKYLLARSNAEILYNKAKETDKDQFNSILPKDVTACPIK